MSKYPLGIIISLVLAASSCRKIEPHQLPSNGIKGPSHCLNGIKDGDETFLDCGGSCTDCETVIAPCSVPENTVYTSLGTTHVYSGTQIIGSAAGSSYQLTADNDTLSIVFTFPFDEIMAGMVYTVNTGVLTSDQIAVSVNKPFYPTMYGETGSVYINYSDGKYILEFCEINLYGSGSGMTMAGSIILE